MGNYQTPTKIRFYTSTLLWGYTAGFMYYDPAESSNISTDGEYNVILNDPSIKSLRSISANDNINYILNWDSGNHTPANSYDYMKHIFDFNYIMLLGHNFKDAGIDVELEIKEHDNTTNTLDQSTYINSCGEGSPPAYNGFSINYITSNHMQDTSESIKIKFKSGSDGWLNSFLIGKYWDTPVNCDINTSLEYKYGVKQKKTASGKTMSKLNYYKTDDWLLGAWQQEENFSNLLGYNRPSRSGIRSWKVSFSLFDFKYAMNQWNFINKKHGFSNNANDDYDEYSAGESKYGILDSIDFYTNVVNRVLGPHLPFAIQLSATTPDGNADNNNADTFAMVRMKDYKITQTNPKFCKISMVLEEQV